MEKWITGFCETNNINIHYTRTGGKGLPLILLHGLMGNGACWIPVARALESEFDVIMPDARGHGKSTVPNTGYRYEDLALDVEGLIDSLELSFPIIVGHSMGGMTAALVASRKRRLLGGLVLAEPTFLSMETQYEVYKSDIVKQQQEFLNRDLQEIIKGAQIKQPHRSLEQLELINTARYQTSTLPLQILKPPNPDYKQLMAEIDIPILLIIAGKGIVSTALSEELKNINPRLRVEQIIQAGHGLHYDQPVNFINLIKSFR